ncbi:unnamed protein product [Fraxinus pennsylvanica]|uniref:Uncharacterized protein n=1 Tax=Fraxinus pennsylvanica TaxID=56036 RepID=A0AAD2EGU1_9LAMI|nr:unnamed protein product [Fraxinus pennsylvanica]
MDFSENLLAMEQPWGMFCQTFADSWFCDVFSKAIEALTKVLQNSFANPSIENNSSHEISTDTVESFLVTLESTPVQTPTAARGLRSGVPDVVQDEDSAAAGEAMEKEGNAPAEGGEEDGNELCTEAVLIFLGFVSDRPAFAVFVLMKC